MHKLGISIAFVGLALATLVSADAATISAVSVAYDVTDFSSSGYHIGTDGYWFANVGATSPITDGPIDQNDANALPSWAVLNFPSSFPVDNLDGKPYAVSQGGLPGANVFTLPDGSVAGSGQVVDVRMTTNNSDTLIKDITFDANSPAGLYFHVVLDNVPLSAGTQIDRVRATYRLPEDGDTIVRGFVRNTRRGLQWHCRCLHVPTRRHRRHRLFGRAIADQRHDCTGRHGGLRL